jgi:DNA invertase Pin-like site-specific DNA recombinase
LKNPERRSWPIIADHVEVASGRSTSGRPILGLAIDCARQSKAVLVVAKLDRLSRDVVDFAQMLTNAERDGFGILALDLPIDTTTAVGRFTALNIANAAELERRLIGERTKAALRAKKARGARLGRPSALPGQLRDRVVRERAAGLTLRAIADGLNRDRVQTMRTADLWTVSTVQGVLRTAELDREAARAMVVARGVAGCV